MSAREHCIIGGGPVGIGMGKCFTQAGVPFRIFEAEEDFGGTWALTQGSGLVYRSTHLISSKKNTQLSDVPMPDDYPSYPSHELFLAYLRRVAERFDLRARTDFRTRVERVEPIGETCRVTLSTGEVREFSSVIVANGRLRKPVIPRYPGTFSGVVVHSGQYKSPSIFDGKRVLIVGAGNSGCDIAVDAVARADRTIQSTRRGYHYMPKFIHGKPTQDWLMEIGSSFSSSEDLWRHVKKEFKAAGFDPVDYGLPAPDHRMDQAHPIMNSLVLYHIGHGDIAPKPDVAELDGSLVRFVDGSEEHVDVIVHASGFEMDFPFLPPGIAPTDGARDLFMGLMHRRHENLLFAGFINAASGLGNLMNCAGAFVADYLRAREARSSSFSVLREIVAGPEPDLGRGRFVSSNRHKAEVDLWQYIKTLNFLRAKLAR